MFSILGTVLGNNLSAKFWKKRKNLIFQGGTLLINDPTTWFKSSIWGDKKIFNKDAGI